MCYKGGPRCANHLRTKISKLKSKIDNGDKTSHTMHQHREAVREYNGTRTGQKELKEKLPYAENAMRENQIKVLLETSAEERKALLREKKAREQDPRLQEIQENMDTLSKNIESFNDGLSSNYLGSRYASISKWREPWTKDEEENLQKVNALSEVLSEKNPDFSKAKNIIGSMADIDRTKKYQSNTFGAGIPNEHSRRDQNLRNLAQDMYKKAYAERIPTPKTQEREPNTRLTGLREAQELQMGHHNYMYDSNNMGHDHKKLLDSSLNRIASGEEYQPWTGADDESSSLVPKHDRFLNEMHNNQPLYLSTAFPDIELKKSMDQQNVDNVSVTPFQNGREDGNAYTVMTPDGGTRTFSVYEHRNSDSIIINGKTNWRSSDPHELPYSGESKNTFFAEFHPDDKQKAADALTFYMKEAQNGNLASDEELARTAGKRDWNTILSESVPGFSDWVQKQGGEKPKSNPTDDDILKSLDF